MLRVFACSNMSLKHKILLILDKTNNDSKLALYQCERFKFSLLLTVIYALVLKSTFSLTKFVYIKAYKFLLYFNPLNCQKLCAKLILR